MSRPLAPSPQTVRPLGSVEPPEAKVQLPTNCAFATSAFRALNPRGRVPVIEDDGFALYESAAMVEYIEDKHPGEPRLFASDIRTLLSGAEGSSFPV